MKKETIILSLFVIIGLFIAGCTPGESNETNNQASKEINEKSDEQKENIESSANLKGNYLIDSENPIIKWSSSKIASNYHTGSTNIKSGTLTFDEKTKGSFIIDMTSIKSDDNIEALVKHLKSDDFFKTETYPESKIIIKSIKPMTNSDYEIIADLTILNITNEIIFIANIITENENLAVNSEFTIDRTKWRINYGSGSIFSDLGDKAIKDDIKFNLDLVLTKVD